MKKDSLKIRKSRSGLGLFSTSEISKGDFVIEYTGEKITHLEANKRMGKYLFTLNSKFVIDARNRNNIARYINHSCKPNCEAIIESGKIKIYALRNIASSEELTYDYGREYFNENIKPKGCKCDNCSKQNYP